MSLNRYAPHLYVLPEDAANADLARGFLTSPYVLPRRMQILPEAGGWLPVIERFKQNELVDLRRFPNRRMLLLVDFDGDSSRLETVRTAIPQDLADRVFVLGARSEPEDLRASVGASFEEIGLRLAQACAEGTRDLWTHELLAHNDEELCRLERAVRPFLLSNR